MKKLFDSEIRNTLQDIIGSPGRLPDATLERVVKAVRDWDTEEPDLSKMYVSVDRFPKTSHIPNPSGPIC